MVEFYSFTGSFGYVVPLWILTGMLILVTDVRKYRSQSLNREAKASKILGWVNVSIGFALFIVKWML